MKEKLRRLTREQAVWWRLLAVVLIYVIAFRTFSDITILFADALRGLEVMRYNMHFGTFNLMYYPLPSQPDVLTSTFVSWWTPGQYQWLQLWMMMGLSMEKAVLLASMMVYLVGILGWIRLWRRSGFNKLLLPLAALLILNRNTYWFTIMYMGGDVLMFAVLPYFIHAVLWQRKLWRWLPLWIVLGLWAKASFIVIAIPAVVIRYWSKRFYLKTYLELVPTIVVAVVVYLYYFQQGSTPTNTTDLEGYVNLPHNRWNGLLYALSAPLSSTLWAWSVIESLWKNQIVSEWMVYAMFVVMIVATAFILKKVSIRRLYTKIAIGVWLFYSVFFSVQQMMMSAISFEVRHFVPVGILFMPVIWDTLNRNIKPQICNALLVAVLLTGVLDMSRIPFIHRSIEESQAAYNGLLLPVNGPIETLKEQSLLVTDVWEYVVTQPHLTHKMVVEKNEAGMSEPRFKLIHGIESSQRPQFNSIGRGRRPLVGVFFRLDKEDVQQLVGARTIVMEQCDGYIMVREIES